MRGRHFREIAEAADDGIEVGEFGFQSSGGLVEDFLELTRGELARALQIFDRDLQGKERIAQLVGEAAGQFAPGSYALGLNEPFLLRSERAGKAIRMAAVATSAAVFRI